MCSCNKIDDTEIKCVFKQFLKNLNKITTQRKHAFFIYLHTGSAQRELKKIKKFSKKSFRADKKLNSKHF